VGATFEFDEAASGRAVVRVLGEMDLSDEAPLDEMLRDVLVKHRPEVVFGLRRLTFADSTALNGLIRAKREMDEVGMKLLLAIGARMDELFAITALLDVFDKVELG